MPGCQSKQLSCLSRWLKKSNKNPAYKGLSFSLGLKQESPEFRSGWVNIDRPHRAIRRIKIKAEFISTDFIRLMQRRALINGVYKAQSC